MNKNKNRRGKSAIFALLSRFSEYIYSKMPESLSAKLFVRSEKKNNGLFSALIRMISFKKRVSLPVKRYMAKAFDNSYVLTHLRALVSKIPLIHLKCVGAFYFAFGLYSTLVNLVTSNLTNLTSVNPDLHLSIASCVVGGIFISSQKSCYVAFSESKIFSSLFIGFFSIPKNDTYLRNDPIGKAGYFFLSGIIAGVIGSLTSVKFIVILFPALLTLYAIIAFPECGAIGLFFFIPFLNIRQLAAFSLLVSASWFIKLIRGKRIFKFDALDITVIFFSIAILFSGIFSVSPNESKQLAYILLSMISGYFAVSNLLRTATWIKKCTSALIASFAITLLMCLVGEVEEIVQLSQVKSIGSIITDAVGSLSTVGPTFIHMSVAVIPIILCMSVSSHRANKRSYAIFALIASLFCLFSGGSRSGFSCLIIGALLILMLTSKRSLAYIIPTALIIPAVIALLPSGITSYVDKLFSFDGSIASYRQSINFTTNKIMSDSFFGGIGLGDAAMAKVYPLYANDTSLGITHASSLYSQIIVSLGFTGLIILLVFIIQLIRDYFTYNSASGNDDPTLKLIATSTFAGISALLIMGLIDYIWYSPSVFLMFWLITALFKASVRTAVSDRYERVPDGPTLELDCNNLNHFSKRKG